MSKKNKWTIVPFIFIATLIFVLLYYLTIRKPSRPAEPIKAVPVSASVIIKVNDFKALFEKTSHNNPLWSELRNLPLFSRIDRQMHFMDSLIRTSPEIEQIIENTPSFISAHVTGNEKISLMHVFQLPPRLHQNKVKEIISRLLVNSGTINVRNYEGIELYEVALPDHSDVNDFSFAFYRDILMISFSATVIEDAIRQLAGEESLLTVPGFKDMYATAGKNVDANVFVNFQQFPKSLSTFVKADYKSEVRALRNFAGWAELDLNPLSDMILMNGFISIADSVTSMASLLLNQAPQRMTADEILPSSVASFITLNIPDADRYFNDYRAFLKEQGNLTAYSNTLLSLNNAYGTNFPADFFEIMDKEMTLGLGGNAPEGSPSNIYFILRIKSKAQTEEKLNSIISGMAKAESKPADDFITRYRFDEDLSFNMVHLPVRHLMAKIFGSLFSVLDEHYGVVLDNYLVFSGSEESLKSLIHDYILNKTLKNDPAFKEFRNNLSPRSNLVFYCNLSKSLPFYSTYLTASLSKAWQKNLGVFRNVQVMGMQLNASNHMLYANFLVRHLASFNTSAQTVWESKLDTLAAFKPVFVINHQTGQNEVFVQDLKNTIYLINQVGRILWKVQLTEPINSEVFQVDYFRNGKLQLLFSTRSALYLIDRNGNFVEKYPVKLRSPATNGAAVFDYDGNREYRIFIACEDKHVYAYNREGNLLEGWEFGQSESTVNQPLNHYRIGDRDFLVFGDGYRTYILDRRGNPRINVDSYFPQSSNNNYALNLSTGSVGPSVVTTDTTGKVYFIGFNGNVTTAELKGKFTNRHYFDFRDLNGDNKPEYIFLESDKLTVFSNDQSELFTYKFNKPITSKPLYYHFSNTDRKLGVVSVSENLIYLFNSNGDLYEGFPLQGNTPFSIGNFGDSLSRFNLVVGSRDNFLYNYRVK